MKKRLGIMTASQEMSHEYKRQIQCVFEDKIECVRFFFDVNYHGEIKDIDVLLVSTYSQYEIVKKYIVGDVKVVVSKKTITKEGANLLRSSQTDKKVMLVNLSYEMCIDSIASLHQIGFHDYEFVPVYPQMVASPSNIKTAITFGETKFVPETVDYIIDLGHRYLDKNTIVDIAFGLELEDILSYNSMHEYCDLLVEYDKGIEFLIGKSITQKNQINTLLSIMNKGVLCIKSDGMIESCNENAKNLIGVKEDIVEKNIKEILPMIYGDNENNRLIEVDGNHLTFSVIAIKRLTNDNRTDDADDKLIVLESFETQEKVQNKLRIQIANKGHNAKYDVKSIIGKSDEIIAVRELVERMGNSNSPVLITGESGTGKELIAQAIHNASPVRNNQFVAINCAALSASLLESELFGYEAGAFTGASKNGKIGIFELAHKGTLFLDEIGEMPLELQTKLLRVIQENEVRRVGGDKIIKVNVRIVSATNRVLYDEVEKGVFRKDLFYRLNVLPINVPALRDRGDDIRILTDFIKFKNGCTFVLSNEVNEFFKSYLWPGNIRELINCIEYIKNMGSQCVELKHLPHYMITESKLKKAAVDHNHDIFASLNAKESIVLRMFFEAFKRKKKIGRRQISDQAFDKNVSLSENDVRVILKHLKELGYIEVNLGRGGSNITQKGIELIEEKSVK